jgi:predicted PurR-regulated permease PerM
MAVDAPVRSIVRTVLVIVGVVLVLYLVYLLRKPLTWLFIAAFIAVALSGPVNYLNRYMKRGFAITLVFLGLLSIPFLLGALLIPPIVTEGRELVDNAPAYAQDVREWVDKNKTLREIDEDYNVTDKLEEEAAKLPDKVGDAAGVLRDIGFGLVNSIFALITILVLAAFMLGSGRQWMERALELQPPDRADRLRRVFAHIAEAVSGYVGGALLQATIAGIAAYIMLLLLGVEFRAPLAVLIFFFDLIPLVGATIGSVLVGIVTLFTDFPTATIVWAVFAIGYQQFENYVIQPQIQKRTVKVHPFVVLVSVLFGGTLLGVLGALLAIPVAASLQIALREWWEWRLEAEEAERAEALASGEPPPPRRMPGPPPGAGPEPAPES